MKALACALLITVTLGGATGHAAQATRPLSPGDKVFVLRRSDDPITGKVAELSDRTLILDVDRDRRSIPLSNIVYLKKSAGVNGPKLAGGALVGAVLTAGVTAGVWLGLCSLLSSGPLGSSGSSNTECVSRNAGPYIVAGALLGGLIGTAIAYEEQWEGIALKELYASVAPTTSGMTASVSIRF